MGQDAYFKKVVDFRFSKRTLQFRVSQDLFSSHDVDIGTQRLLRTLADAPTFQKILDLGCGYGPLGLTLKKREERSIVHMVDRDALAVEYSRQNAALNQLSDVEIYGSLGYDDVPVGGFDLILSNIPAKAGQPVLAHLLRDARHYLKPAGCVAIVAVAPLEATITEILDDPNIHILLRKVWPGHVIFHYQFIGQPDEMIHPGEAFFERGVYHRTQTTISVRGVEYSMQTVYNLPEFDTLDFRSELLVKGIQSMPDSEVKQVLVFNPGQGHIPVVLWKLFHPEHILLVTRDLLSLRCSKKNLLLNECPEDRVTLSHQIGVAVPASRPVDLVAGILIEGEGRDACVLTVQQALEQTASGGRILLAASSSAATHVANQLRLERRLKINRRERRKGKSLLVFQCR